MPRKRTTLADPQCAQCRGVCHVWSWRDFDCRSVAYVHSTYANSYVGANPHVVDEVALFSIAISAGIYATTIHAQDFKDQIGDRAVGRQTIPIILPSIARYMVIVPMILWSCSLVLVWRLNLPESFAFISFTIFVGMRYLVFRTVHDDQISYYWYNVGRTTSYISN
jgi:hypothetical protein